MSIVFRRRIGPSQSCFLYPDLVRFDLYNAGDNGTRRCPLLGVKRTLVGLSQMSAFDPKRTWVVRGFCGAKLIVRSHFAHRAPPERLSSPATLVRSLRL